MTEAFPCTDENDTSTEKHRSHFVEHLEGPVVDGDIVRPDQEGEDFGEGSNEHIGHLASF